MTTEAYAVEWPRPASSGVSHWRRSAPRFCSPQSPYLAPKYSFGSALYHDILLVYFPYGSSIVLLQGPTPLCLLLGHLSFSCCVVLFMPLSLPLPNEKLLDSKSKEKESYCRILCLQVFKFCRGIKTTQTKTTAFFPFHFEITLFLLFGALGPFWGGIYSWMLLFIL